jgi:hypothetical protein
MQVIPPSRISGGGGLWTYEQPFNGKLLPMTGNSKRELLQKIIDFRVNAELDPLTAGEDLNAYYKQQSAPQQRQPDSLRARVTRWIGNRKFSQNKFVDQEVAEARANMVIGCPYNKTDWADECVECTSKTKADSFSVRAGKGLPFGSDSLLGACTVYGHDNKTAVWLDKDNLKHRVQVPNPPTDACCKRWLATNEKPNGKMD